MDFLYAGVLLFFTFYLSLYIVDKRKTIKKAAEFGIPESYDLSRLFQSYAILIILFGFILYFLFR